MKKIILILIAILILMLIPLSIFYLSRLKNSKTDTQTTPTTTTRSQQQAKFKILSVNPVDNATNVYPGEIAISFTTDVPILSKNNFSIEASPQLLNPLQIKNTFPTTTVEADVLGGLQTNTKYTITVRDSQKNVLTQWGFTTAATPAENSTGLVNQRDKKITQDYYPLANDIPYQTNDFKIDYYEGHLKLHVTILNPNINLSKEELYSWIKSKGVDPTTHTYDFINGF